MTLIAAVYQMWPHCLSKLIYLLIAVMQSFICQIYFCHSYKERPSETLLSDDKFRNKHLLPYFRNTSTLKVIEKIKETRGWFFEKIALLKLQPDSLRGTKVHINKIINEIREIKKNHEYYANKFDSLEEINKFLETYNLQKLNQEKKIT